MRFLQSSLYFDDIDHMYISDMLIHYHVAAYFWPSCQHYKYTSFSKAHSPMLHFQLPRFQCLEHSNIVSLTAIINFSCHELAVAALFHNIYPSICWFIVSPYYDWFIMLSSFLSFSIPLYSFCISYINGLRFSLNLLFSQRDSSIVVDMCPYHVSRIPTSDKLPLTGILEYSTPLLLIGKR